VVSGFLLGRHRDRAMTEQGGSYVCPMHPDVRANAPRECSICGMALVKVGSLPRESAASTESEAGGEGDAIAAAQLLTKAAGGVATSLLTYNATPVRRRVLPREPLLPAWVDGDAVAVLLYDDELGTLASDEHATFFATSSPDVAVDLRYRGGSPAAWDRSTSVVRFDFAEPTAARAAPPAMPGWVELARKPRESVVVPAMSVLQSTEGPYVLVFSAERGTASKRPVAIGKMFSGFAAVVSGVLGRELVVSMNTFFWDAERRLQAEQRAGGGVSP
jgi:multidrug efflux pump subunit AcrA (membrane-fusion protein)